MGRSAENLTRIVDEDEGATGGMQDGVGVEGASAGSSANLSVGCEEEAGAPVLVVGGPDSTAANDAGSMQDLSTDARDESTERIDSAAPDVPERSESDRAATVNQGNDDLVSNRLKQPAVTITVEGEETLKDQEQPIHPEITIVVDEDNTESNHNNVADANVKCAETDDSTASALEAAEGKEETGNDTNQTSRKSKSPERDAKVENEENSGLDFWAAANRTSRSRSSSPQQDKRYSSADKSPRGSITDVACDADTQSQVNDESAPSFWDDIQSDGIREKAIQDKQIEESSDHGVVVDSHRAEDGGSSSFWNDAENESNSKAASTPDTTYANGKETAPPDEKHSKNDSEEDVIRNEIQPEQQADGTAKNASSEEENKPVEKNEPFSFGDVSGEDAGNGEVPPRTQTDEDAGSSSTGNEQPKEKETFSFWDIQGEEDSNRSSDQPKAEDKADTTTEDNQGKEEKPFSFWDVSVEERNNEAVPPEKPMNVKENEEASQENRVTNDTSFSFWVVTKENGPNEGTASVPSIDGQDAEKIPEDEQTSKEKPFTFWDVSEEAEKAEETASTRQEPESTRLSLIHI